MRRTRRDTSAAAGQALWWPPAKIAGRYLAPYLATARPSPLAEHVLADRLAVPGPPVSDEEQQDALELALLLADSDARWGDYASALNALDAAEAAAGSAPARVRSQAPRLARRGGSLSRRKARGEAMKMLVTAASRHNSTREIAAGDHRRSHSARTSTPRCAGSKS